MHLFIIYYKFIRENRFFYYYICPEYTSTYNLCINQ